MTLRVAVQSGLSNFTEKLKESGYEVVSMEDNTEAVDVIVYSGVSNDLTGFDTVDYYGDNATMGVNNPSGVMLVNTHSHSAEQVVSLINQRFSQSV